MDKRGSTKIDVQTLLAALTHLKELELQAEQENRAAKKQRAQRLPAAAALARDAGGRTRPG